MAKRQAVNPITALVPGAQSNLEFMESAREGVVGFLKKLPAFFRRADEIESTATVVLAQARRAQPPKDAGEDETLQHAIQNCNRAKSVVQLHWDGSKEEPGITALFFRLHRRLTAKRDTAVKMLDEAAGIYNGQHNRFVAEQRAKAEAEQRRLQAIADAEAKAVRDAELAALAEAAKKARGAEKAALKAQAVAVASAPVERVIVAVAPEVSKAAGVKERTTRKARIVDAQKLIAAVFAGEVPRDVLCIDEVRLNQYARDLGPALNRWAGVELDETTKVI